MGSNGGWEHRLVEMAELLPGIIQRGQLTEDHAVKVLVSAAVGQAPLLREAALEIRGDPDAVPLSVALLDQAAELAAAPSPPARRRWP
jgi:hypothetical protein